jgi:hypothetical protein
MKKTYFKPEFKIVKLHGRAHLLQNSVTSIRSSKTNLSEDDDFEYVGPGAYEGR